MRSCFKSFQEFHEVPFLKKFKFKRQDRVYPKEAPPQTTTAVKAEAVAGASSGPTERATEAATSGQRNVETDVTVLTFCVFVLSVDVMI